MNQIARHPRAPELVDTPLEEIVERYIGRFADRMPDWSAFADARIPGFRRAQHRFIGNTSGKPDPKAIPAGSFTLSVMYVPAGEGNAAHTHEVEEIFFILQGHLVVFFEDEEGKHIEVGLGPWDCAACPAGVIHGYKNISTEPVFLQVMVGKRDPEFMGYSDPNLFANRDDHTKVAAEKTT